MDFTPYLPNSLETKYEYYTRLWRSDSLWEALSTTNFDVPNETIRFIQSLKWRIYSRTRQELATMMRDYEDEMRVTKDDRRYMWLKLACRRVYKRKNLLAIASSSAKGASAN